MGRMDLVRQSALGLTLICAAALGAGPSSAAPADVALSIPSNATMHSLDLSWSASTDSAFSHYEVRRHTSSGVSASSTLADTIRSQSTTTLTDSTLGTRRAYYYRVFVVDTTGARSSGSNEVSGTTLGVGFPFSDDFEGGLVNWDLDAPWALTTESAHSADHSLTDSPNTLYQNSVGVSATLGVDLSGSSRPLL